MATSAGAGRVWILDLEARSLEAIDVIDLDVIEIQHRHRVDEDSQAIELHHLVETLAGIWPVTDHVTQTDDTINILAADILHDRLEGGQVPLDIANDRSSCHRTFTETQQQTRCYRPCLSRSPSASDKSGVS